MFILCEAITYGNAAIRRVSRTRVLACCCLQCHHDLCCVLCVIYDSLLVTFVFRSFGDTCLRWFVTWENVFCTTSGTLCVLMSNIGLVESCRKKVLSQRVVHTELVIIYINYFFFHCMFMTVIKFL
jgi:hypothetical protein